MPKAFVLLVVNVVCCSLISPATAQEPSVLAQCPPENPPQILVAFTIDSEDHLVLVWYHSIFIGFTGESYNERLTRRVSLEGVQILTAGGKETTLEAARDRISERDTPILVTSSKTRLPKFFAAMFAPETLHFVFPAKAPQWREIESPGARVEE